MCMKLTVRLDVAMNDVLAVKIRQSLQHLKGIELDDLLVLNPTMLQQIGQTASLTKLHENEDFVSMDLDVVVPYNVGVVQHLHHLHLVVDRLDKRHGRVLESNLLDCNQLSCIRVGAQVNC